MPIHALPEDDLIELTLNGSTEFLTPISCLLEQTAYENNEESLNFLSQNNPFTDQEYQDIKDQTLQFIENLKQQELPFPKFTEFLNHHQLTSEEGTTLLYLAEAILRIPDASTADLLIQDQLNAYEWSNLVSENSPSFVKLSAWALSRIGTFFSSLSEKPVKKDIQKVVTQILKKSSESVLRQMLISAVRFLGNQCIFAETMAKAVKKSVSYQEKGYRLCYQLLGQEAATVVQAEEFYVSCAEAIRVLGETKKIKNFPSIAFKLSDLYPRYCLSQFQKIITELGPKLTNLAILAKENAVGLVIEAEESAKMLLTLKLVEHLIKNPRLQDWPGLEIVIQSYQKRSSFVIQWLADLARACNTKIVIRLVKGLLWDQEIRQAQEEQKLTYPVYISKSATDAAYFVCAQKMIDNSDVLTAHFSTHNVFSVFGVQKLIDKSAKEGTELKYEFQKGYGKGEGIFATFLTQNMPCSLIAPIGNKNDILSSVVRHFVDSKVNHAFLYEVSKNDPSLEKFVRNPFHYLNDLESPAFQLLALEKNTKGISLALTKKINALRYRDVLAVLGNQKSQVFEAVPVINGIYQSGVQKSVYNPSHIENSIGVCVDANESQAQQALDIAVNASAPWSCLNQRLSFLKQLAIVLESRLETLLYLAVVETGLTLNDAMTEVLEALRTCYQIAQDVEHYGQATELETLWAEKKTVQWERRGAFVCLSSWNSPILSVVKGLVAALATNNNVILKPAASASLIAAQIVECFYAAGAPKESLAFLPGNEKAFPFELLTDPRLSGVAFFGSKRTALKIQNILSVHEKSSFSFVGHGVGTHVMIIDSSALLNCVVEDVIVSAFRQSGQLPGTLRLVLVQEEIAEQFIKILKGKMLEWCLGDPLNETTDSGPIINEKAYRKLVHHTEEMHDIGTLLYKSPTLIKGGWFFPPKVYELKELTHFNTVAFGPILHLVRFKHDQIHLVIKQLNENFPGLILNIRSTVHSFCNTVSANIRSEEVVINGALKPFMQSYSSAPLEKRMEYLKKFVLQKTLFMRK